MKTNKFSMDVVTPIRFRLIMEKTMHPITDWMDGFTVDVSLGGVKIIARMSEDRVELLVRQYTLIKLLFQLPGAPAAITATGAVAYFRRGKTESRTSTIVFGVTFAAIDYSAMDIIGEFILRRTESSTFNKIYHIQDKKKVENRMKPRMPAMARVNFAV
jgi:hypothetical protein